MFEYSLLKFIQKLQKKHENNVALYQQPSSIFRNLYSLYIDAVESLNQSNPVDLTLTRLFQLFVALKKNAKRSLFEEKKTKFDYILSKFLSNFIKEKKEGCIVIFDCFALIEHLWLYAAANFHTAKMMKLAELQWETFCIALADSKIKETFENY